ncbi:hypothetical protein K431DRAFT_293925 [Polychaeton citri CBS 116435]|uniref:Uncharacterized protein n=1 Tax=Polychaeton citri CBS 116435 TaxID=1314669 RepID=A0A9P4QB90_9PEZI|nr:hypothetical protein K431DRAFT_293925 [Polychaeton citri CBS 116435]
MAHRPSVSLAGLLRRRVSTTEPPKARDYVRVLSIVPLFLAPQPNKPLKHGYLHNWSRSVRDVEAYKSFHENHDRLRAEGVSRKLLIRLLTNLPKLQKLTLTESIDALPFEANTIGFSKLLRLTGVSVMDLSATQYIDHGLGDLSSDVWSTMLQAMGKATLKELHCLNVDCAAGFPWIRFKQLRLGALKAAHLEKALARVQSLSIGIDICLSSTDHETKNIHRIYALVPPFASAFSNINTLHLTLTKPKTETLQAAANGTSVATTSEGNLKGFLSEMERLKFLEGFDLSGCAEVIEYADDHPHPNHPERNSRGTHTRDCSTNEVAKFPDYNDSPYVCPGSSSKHEREYFVCLRGKHVREMLAIFMKERNLEDFYGHNFLGVVNNVFAPTIPIPLNHLMDVRTNQGAQHGPSLAGNTAQHGTGHDNNEANGQGADRSLPHPPACSQQ